MTPRSRRSRSPPAKEPCRTATAGSSATRAAGRWHLIDGQGAELGVDGKLWLLRGRGDDLHAVQVAWLDALDAFLDAMIAATTLPDHDTPSGGTGTPLGMSDRDGSTIAALRAVKAEVATVRQREAKVLRS